MLDYNKPTPPLPASCVALTERFSTVYSEISLGESCVAASEINQLTINEYLPGQGIAPHTGMIKLNFDLVLILINLASLLHRYGDLLGPRHIRAQLG